MKKLLAICAVAALIFAVAGPAHALYMSTFTINQADFSLSGFSSGGPDSLYIDQVTGTYNLDIPPAGGLYDVYMSGSLWADFDEDGTPDATLLDFDEYVGTYASPGPSASWGPGSIPFTAEYGGTSYNFTLGYQVDLDGGYPSGNFGPNAYADLILSGDPAGMYLGNAFLTQLDNQYGGGDGVIDGLIGGSITVTAAPVPEPATILLVGTGLLGMIGFGRKRLNKKA